MILLAIFRALLLIITMTVYLLCYAVTRLIWKHTPESSFKLRRHWVSNMCLPILNIKVEMKGTPPKGGTLCICNHRSLLDPAIISKYMDAYIIAKAEIADYPIINKGAEVTGIIWVKRDSKDSRAATRQAYIDTIAKGYNVLVYPEGTVSTQKETLPFKRGTLNEAAKNGFKVVPAAIEYRDKSDLWTINGLLGYYLKQASKWAIHTKLTFGPEIESDDGDHIHEEAYKWVNEEVARMQKKWSRAFTDEN